MKISNSKQQLAKIISENGGWRNGEFAAQDGDGGIGGYEVKPEWDSLAKYWWREASGQWFFANKIKNHHQTVLSRAEYFHLYPSPDADGWIEWKGGECPVDHGVMIDVRYRDGVVRKCMPALEPVADYHDVMHQYWQNDGVDGDIIAYRLHKPEQSKPEFCESVMRSIPEPTAKPTIEQLAADYRAKLAIAQQAQEEADSHRCGAEAALGRLERAGEELGLLISPVKNEPNEPKNEPELNITDWESLRSGDVIWWDAPSVAYAGEYKIAILPVPDNVNYSPAKIWNNNSEHFIDIRKDRWRFIRRP